MTDEILAQKKLPDNPSFQQALDESNMCDEFVGYCASLWGRWCLIVDEEKKIVHPVRAISATRYSNPGRDKIKRKIKDRMGSYWCKGGVKLELTFDGRGTKTGKPISRGEAWRSVNKETGRVMDDLNKVRRRKGIKSNLSYLWVLEEQAGKDGKPGTGYPHVHIVFPGLRSLMVNQNELTKLWGNGFTFVRAVYSFGPAGYACKYITKMELFPLMQAYIWKYHLRLYGFSKTFKYRAACRVYGWKFVRVMGENELRDRLKELKEGGYFIHGFGSFFSTENEISTMHQDERSPPGQYSGMGYIEEAGELSP